MVPAMHSSPSFPDRLTAAMEDRGLSSARLLAACKGSAKHDIFSERTVTRWRSGKTAPSIDAIPILAAALDVPAGWLLGEGDNEVPAPTEAAA